MHISIYIYMYIYIIYYIYYILYIQAAYKIPWFNSQVVAIQAMRYPNKLNQSNEGVGAWAGGLKTKHILIRVHTASSVKALGSSSQRPPGLLKEPFRKRKRPYLDPCLAKIAFDYCIRKLSSRSTTCIPSALSKNIILKKGWYIYICICIYTYAYI